MNIILGLLKWLAKWVIGILAALGLYVALVYAWGLIAVWVGELIGKSAWEIDDYAEGVIVAIVIGVCAMILVGGLLQNALQEYHRLRDDEEE